MHVTYRRVTRDDVTDARSLIGVSLPDLDLYVLDERGEPVPEGVAGELYVGGAGVARGYLDREALTRERFVAHPFRAGERLYRSGDTARWVAGDLEYLGRLDAQVQLRGFRVEPGEIEVTLRAHPAARDAVVLHRDDGPRGARLVAYAVGASEGAVIAADHAVDGAALRRWLARRLPEHMVPSSVVLLDALPLTSNGKLDRAALLALDDAGAPVSAETQARPDEELLGALFASLLGRERVGAHESFFDAGGHSLLGTQLVSKIRDTFGVELPLRRLFERPTIAGLAEAIRAGDARATRTRPPRSPAAGASRRRAPAVVRSAADGSSISSRAVGDLQRPAVRPSRGALDVSALSEPPALVERHQILRLRVVMLTMSPEILTDASAFALSRVDLTVKPTPKAPSARGCVGTRRAPSTSRASCRSGHLLARGPARHVAAGLHHIAPTGGRCRPAREWASLYGARSTARRRDSQLAVQYTDFAAWQRNIWRPRPGRTARLLESAAGRSAAGNRDADRPGRPASRPGGRTWFHDRRRGQRGLRASPRAPGYLFRPCARRTPRGSRASRGPRPLHREPIAIARAPRSSRSSAARQHAGAARGFRAIELQRAALPRAPRRRAYRQ